MKSLFTEVDPFFCHYGTDILLPLVHKLAHELKEAAYEEDIEPVHQSRVASRRIRAALPIFSVCFSEDTVRCWNKNLKSLTSALGTARDLDVQIAFLNSFISEDPAISGSSPTMFTLTGDDLSSPAISPVMSAGLSQGTHNSESFGLSCCGSNRLRTGIDCLLLRLTQKRIRAQKKVIKTVHQISRSDLLSDMEKELKQCKDRVEQKGINTCSPFSYEQAYFHIISRIYDLISYKESLSDPDAIQKHHKMRIAAKKLRYSLEVFSGLFNDRLHDEIQVIKRIQELLGDIHDCDVWVQFLPEFLEEEKITILAYTGNARLFNCIVPGIMQLIENRSLVRESLFSELCGFWNTLTENSFFEDLTTKISIAVPFQSEPCIIDSGLDSYTIACISDIHANLPALQAVVSDARSRGAALFLNAGDSVGYGGFPDEVITFLRENGIITIAGNFDLAVVDKKWNIKKKDPKHKRNKNITLRWTYHNLSHENRVYLRCLPKQLMLNIEDKKILITHGSPSSMNEYLTRETPLDRYKQLAESSDADIILSGHAHIPSVIEAGGVTFINCGSVGRSEDGDPRACYALVSLDPFSVEHIRVTYDIPHTVSRLRERHLPREFEWMTVHGCSPLVVPKPEDGS